MKFLTGVAGAVLVLGSLTACGGGDDEYCSAIEDAQKQFEGLENGEDFDQLGDAIDTLQGLGEDAPDDVADDWEVFNDALADFQTALDDAGVSGADLEAMQNGEIPEGLDDPATMEDLTTASQALTSEEVSDAGDAIKKHAEETCDVDFS